MYFAVLFLLLILVFYLNNLCNKDEHREKRKNKTTNKNNGSTLNLGWRITPYLKYKISSFESRRDLEKMRIREVIKNNLNIKEENITFCEEMDNFYISNKDEILYGKFVLLDNKENLFEKCQSLKKDDFTQGELYRRIANILKKHLYLVEEGLIHEEQGIFKITFPNEYIFLSISREEGLNLNKEDLN